MDFFNVTQYQVNEARKLLESKGILAIPDKKKGCGLADEILKDVLLFYEDYEYSRQMPGKKDCVSIGKKTYRQKRLLLCNLNELYSAFKEKYPHHKIGISKFCELRPKWCVTVSSSGAHSVCMCTIHQNTQLIVDAFSSTVNSHIRAKNQEKRKEEIEDSFKIIDIQKFECDYKDLMKMIICDIDNLECMVHRCVKCPGYQNLQCFVEKKLEEYDIDEDISYKHWDSTEHTKLQTIIVSVEEFVNELVYQVDNLSKHSFIAKSQARYLKERKDNIDETSCIVLLDFAENYHYIVQDEVQGYH